MSKIELGKIQLQSEGYKAFVPFKFPPQSGFLFSKEIILKASKAMLMLGKLDGITLLLPDLDFFLFMYIRKDATASSQIEGTQATLIDAIEAEGNISSKVPSDVDDILHYIHALNYGLERLEKLPISLRFIKELHFELMKGARKTHFSDPGNFRKSQNWIGGTSPDNARFVPPPPNVLMNALGDLENFIYANEEIIPLIKAGIIHAHFETIHPFLDGNGRTGRLLITIFLWITNLLAKPTLFLSAFFKKHQKLYYEKLSNYHNGEIEIWLDFFLEGVIETAAEAIETVQKITVLRNKDLLKIHSLGKAASKSAVNVFPKLFEMPIVDVAKIQNWTGFSRLGAQKVIDRFIEMGILEIKDEGITYGRSYIYRQYVDIF